MNRKRLQLLLLTICLLVVTIPFRSFAQPMSGIYTVNSAIPTSAVNFESFTDLADSLTKRGVSGPVTINVIPGSGPYNEQVSFGAIAGVSAAFPVIVKGNGEEIYFHPTPAKKYIIELVGTDWITFDSLRVFPDTTLAPDYCYSFFLRAGTSNVTIDRCYIMANATYTLGQSYIGIYQYYNSGDSNQYINNEFRHCGYATLITGWKHGPNYDHIMEGNYVHQCGVGLYAYKYSQRVAIRNNRIEDGYYGTLHNDHAHDGIVTGNTIRECVIGIYVADTSRGTYIADNDVYCILPDSHRHPSSYTYAILFSDSTGLAVVERNKLVAQYIGIRIERLSDSIQIFNNSVTVLRGGLNYRYRYGILIRPTDLGWVEVYNNSVQVHDTSFHRGLGLFYDGTGTTGNSIVNNSFTGSDTLYGAIYVRAASVSLMDIDHNNYYNTDPTRPLAYFDGYCDSLADIRMKGGPAGHDMYSVSGDPEYTSDENLIPLGFLLDAAGTNAPGMTEDFKMNPRPAVPGDSSDIGCYEFDPYTPFPIRGIVYEDVDSNCILGSPDMGEPGIIVELLRMGSVIERDTTDASGYFSFTPTEDGAYRIRIRTSSVTYDTCTTSFIDISLGSYPDSSVSNEFLVQYDTAVPNNVLDIVESVGINCYPNPTSGLLTIESINGNQINGEELRIYGPDGRLVKKLSVDANYSYNIDLGSFTKGIYILEIMIKDGSPVRRTILKQ